MRATDASDGSRAMVVLSLRGRVFAAEPGLNPGTRRAPRDPLARVPRWSGFGLLRLGLLLEGYDVLPGQDVTRLDVTQRVDGHLLADLLLAHLVHRLDRH